MKIVKEMIRLSNIKIEKEKKKIEEKKEKKARLSSIDNYFLKMYESENKNIIKLINKVNFQVTFDYSQFSESFTHIYLPSELSDEIYENDDIFRQLDGKKIEEIREFISNTRLMDKIGVKYIGYRNNQLGYGSKPIYGQIRYAS